MGATRKVTYASVANGQEGPKIEYSSAETWGELKNEFPDIQLKSQGMKPWAKSTDPGDKGYELSGDSSKLPSGDVILYFLVVKNDSGTN